MKEQYEPRSPRSTVSKIWDSPMRRPGKARNWSSLPERRRGKVAELAPTIKPVSFGSQIYKIGPYTGTLEEIKQFAAMKGLTRLECGAIKYKLG